MTGDLLERAGAALMEPDPFEKCRAAGALFAAWERGELWKAVPLQSLETTRPGRPQRPRLVHPRDLPRRRPGTPKGRAALIHAIAHIEFNAINLALDAVCRFPRLPRAFYADWLSVAADEARHFSLLQERLASLGYGYGDFPAHDGLWDMARRTAHDPLHRMALVPRVMEARGLDVTPGMILRMRDLGDEETAAVLEVILAEEVGHVAAGSRWFHHLCAERGLEPEATYFDLLRRYLGNDVRCPLHLEARRRAGFSESELVRLEQLCTRP
ncbi:MAG: ferritin-like domain-containing protein [Pseudomonadota bacterium]